MSRFVNLLIFLSLQTGALFGANLNVTTSAATGAGSLVAQLAAANPGDSVVFTITTASITLTSSAPALVTHSCSLVNSNSGAFGAVTVAGAGGLFNIASTANPFTIGASNTDYDLVMLVPISTASAVAPSLLTFSSTQVGINGGIGLGNNWGILLNQVPTVSGGISGPINMSTGSFIVVNNNGTISGTITMVGNTFYANTNMSAEFSGVISGGGLTMGGTYAGPGGGSIFLSALNTYTGPTTITQGTIGLIKGGDISSSVSVTGSAGSFFDISASTLGVCTVQNFGSAGNVVLGVNTLNINNNPATSSTTISGPIGGTGSIRLTGGGTLNLSGANGYTGTTTVNSGTLILGTATAIQSSSAVNNYGTLSLTTPGTNINNLSGSGTVVLGANSLNITSAISTNYTGPFTGSGAISLANSGDMNLTGNSPGYTGTLSVVGGRIGINGSMPAADLSIAANTTLYGTGTILNVTNAGRLAPGNSIGTMTILGNYTQTGALDIEISPYGDTDLLNITGSATISPGSTLNVFPIPGIYFQGQTYTILEAAGGVSGTFTNVTAPPIYSISVIYDPTSIILLNNKDLLPITNADLNGYAAIMANALFCRNVHAKGDLAFVETALVSLSPTEYAETLADLIPEQISGLPIVELENTNRIISLIENRLYRFNQGFHTPCALPDATVWATPISFWLNQKSNGEAFAFKSNTSGVGIGFEKIVYSCLMLGLGSGYTYSKVHWANQLGRAAMNEVYIAPYFSCKFDIPWTAIYLNGSVMGSYDAVKLDRSIRFSVIDRMAESHLNQWNITEMLDLKAVSEISDYFYVVPEGAITFAQLFRQSANEKGADSMNMYYPSGSNSTMRALGNLTLGFKFEEVRSINMALEISGGYQYTQIFSSNQMQAYIIDSTQVCNSYLNTYGNMPATSQVVVGAGFQAQNNEATKVELRGDYTFLGRSNVVEVTLNFESNF
ncbi:MAG: autotransporter outer membrane beta-barrel domain-containing protein [Chlamydiia bacterium]